jgi:putative tricarboxylic transport membrane protein
LVASLYIGNVMLLLLNLPLVGLWVKLLVIPRPWLYAGILVFSTLGAYTLNSNVVDLVILWTIGLLGFGMRVLDVPVAPCVVGLILGPLAEQQFRRALAINQGDPTVFFTHPIRPGSFSPPWCLFWDPYSCAGGSGRRVMSAMKRFECGSASKLRRPMPFA